MARNQEPLTDEEFAEFREKMDEGRRAVGISPKTLAAIPTTTATNRSPTAGSGLPSQLYFC